MYEIVFALNKKYLVDRKWVHRDFKKLKKKPKNFEKSIIKVFYLNNQVKKLNKKNLN